MSLLHFTDDSFKGEVLDYKGVALVDFWAPWCGPCNMLGPIIEEIAGELDGKVKVGKVNVDEERGLAENYQVMSIPMVLVFKDGELVETMIGLQPKESYMDTLKTYLG